MTKADIVEKVAAITGSKKSAESALACVFEQIKKGLKKEGSITFVGFGSFKVAKKGGKERQKSQDR